MTTDSVDLLVFGPHPDDIEIGLGGTVAKHTRLGHRVGLCDLTAGEMSSFGSGLPSRTIGRIGICRALIQLQCRSSAVPDTQKALMLRAAKAANPRSLLSLC